MPPNRDVEQAMAMTTVTPAIAMTHTWTKPSSLLADHGGGLITSDTFGEGDLEQLEANPAVNNAPYSPPPVYTNSPLAPGATVSGPPEDKILRYFHSPHNHAIDTTGTHIACSSCNPHGLPTSKPNSRLSVFPTNYISTTKYTLINFLPRVRRNNMSENLYEQFCKKANFYFLIIAILSFTPLSPKSPLPAIAPLIVVLAITAVKEIAEDYKRYKVDVEINGTLVSVYRFDQWQEVSWANVRAGDIVRVLSEHFFPADLVLLQSSSNQGACSIETANLDGETNLKVKQAVPASYEIKCSDDGLDYPAMFQGVLESDPPNDKMDQNSWNGNFLSFHTQNNQVLPRVPLGFTQLLLRGCRLRNTKWIIGMVCFTGRDTKLMLQAKSKDIKRSNIDRAVDKCLYLIFVFQACVCSVGAIGQSIWLRGSGGKVWYLDWSAINIPVYSFLSYFTYLVLMDILVPISLYVSMELVKFGQAIFISMDNQMKYTSTNDFGEKVEIKPQARTSNLNEELGQVAYIFSDKTGTLTRNEMKFLRCTIGLEEYGPGCMAEALGEGKLIPRHPPGKNIPPPRGEYTFEDNRILEDLSSKLPKDQLQVKQIDEFLTLLAVCHTVMVSYEGCEQAHIHNQDGCPTRVRFNAQSPDELALVDFALDQQYFFHHIEPCKFEFEGRTIQGNRLIVNIRGVQHDFDIFEQLEFTSSRKRCSVIVYDHRDQLVKIYCKGADNVIRERLSTDSLSESWLATNAHLQKFASIGLRTLCAAYRVIPKDEFIAWYDIMQTAKSTMTNRAEAIANASELIEVGFELLGTTAIEDRLQDGVPEAIASLAQAGIKIWVLTGDKVETAINIGRSCKLLTDAMRDENLIVIDIDESLSDADAMQQTLEALAAAEKVIARPNLNLEQVGIVVSGKALGFVFPRRKLNTKNQEIIPPQKILDQEYALQIRFLNLCTACKAVVCCRMSPKQKSQVVRLVKDNISGKITLAIGDGANDVAMIEAAHVGIGIEGLEGKQAVMASDVSIGQFRFLKRLLLIHGAWSYRRLSTLIFYSFYKNITISLCQLWFAFFAGFSGQIFYDQFSATFYNIFFTGAPILLLALFNRDISEETLLTFPKLYSAGQRNECFNLRMFVATIFKGTVDSLLLFFFCVFALHVCSDPANGLENDQWAMSTALFTCCVLVVNAKVAFDTTTWTIYNFIVLVGTIASWWIWSFAFTSSPYNPDTYGVMKRLVAEPNFWLLIIILPVVTLVPDVAFRYIRNTYYPNTAAMGTLYVDYLVDLAAREKKSEQVEADKVDEIASRTDQLSRQETAQELTHQASVRSFDTASRLSLMQMVAAENQNRSQVSNSQTPFGQSPDTSTLQPSDSASSIDSSIASSSWVDRQLTTGAFTMPTRTPLTFGQRHTITGTQFGGGQTAITEEEDQKAAHPPPHPFSRSFSVGQVHGAPDQRKVQTWQQLAKTLKTDNVGFTPFVASEGEADYVMSGRRFRELSMIHQGERTIQIGHENQQ